MIVDEYVLQAKTMLEIEYGAYDTHALMSDEGFYSCECYGTLKTVKSTYYIHVAAGRYLEEHKFVRVYANIPGFYCERKFEGCDWPSQEELRNAISFCIRPFQNI